MRARRAGLAVVSLILVGALLAPAAAVASGSSQTASLDTGVLVQLNAIRVEHGLVPLTLSPELTAAAQAHSSEMVARGYFAHPSANGTPFWKRIQAYYAQTDGSWSVGENLLWSSGDIGATAGMAAWMASPPHRENILDPSWRQIGIAAVVSADAPGTYGGQPVTVITTDFGVRG
jgi:uncharacterized protein YkwD